MADYHDAPFTLTPDSTIPDDAPLSAGHTEADAAEVEQASIAYATEELTLEITVEPGTFNAHAIVAFGDLVFGEDYDVFLNWGDGYDERASAPDEGHPYQFAGRYLVTATVEQPGYASLKREAIAAIGEPEPPEPPVIP